MKKYLLLIASFILTLQIKAQTVSDVDGNTYNTVTIGTQTWLKENLKTTKYNDGTSIPNVTGDAAWSNLTTPAYCWIQNDAATYKATYGALYNWYTINTGKLCPTGWHVPTNAEWTILAGFLGGEDVAGGKLKEAGTTHWSSPNAGADNSTGFTALPGSFRDTEGVFNGGVNYDAYWWTSTSLDINFAWYLSVSSFNNIIFRDSPNKKDGFAVRCLKDDITSSVNFIDKPLDNVIYPNPATDMLYIKNSKLSDTQIIIFDLQGKQVISRKIGSNSIDISNLSKGIYLVKIIDSGNIIMEKLIKE